MKVCQSKIFIMKSLFIVVSYFELYSIFLLWKEKKISANHTSILLLLDYEKAKQSSDLSNKFNNLLIKLLKTNKFNIKYGLFLSNRIDTFLNKLQHMFPSFLTSKAFFNLKLFFLQIAKKHDLFFLEQYSTFDRLFISYVDHPLSKIIIQKFDAKTYLFPHALQYNEEKIKSYASEKKRSFISFRNTIPIIDLFKENFLSNLAIYPELPGKNESSILILPEYIEAIFTRDLNIEFYTKLIVELVQKTGVKSYFVKGHPRSTLTEIKEFFFKLSDSLEISSKEIKIHLISETLDLEIWFPAIKDRFIASSSLLSTGPLTLNKSIGLPAYYNQHLIQQFAEALHIPSEIWIEPLRKESLSYKDVQVYLH